MREIRHQLFKAPTLKRRKLLKIFKRMDRKLSQILTLIQEHTEFADRKLLDYYMQIASGTARFKNYYHKENGNRKDFGGQMKSGFGKEDKLFLINSYDVLHSFYDPIALNKTGFNRYIYHLIIESFMLSTKDYIEVSHQVGKRKYNNLRVKEDIEEKVKVKTNGLYGAIQQIHFLYKDFLRYRDQIIASYLRYVYSLAAKNSKSEVQTHENFQVGTIGLMRAILMYNQSTSFGTYVRYWIKQAITDNVYRSFLITIPACSWTYFNKLERFRQQAANIHELSALTGFSEGHINDVFNRVLTSQVTSLDLLLESPENQNYVSYTPAFHEVSDFENLLVGLTKDEQFVLNVLCGFYSNIENSPLKPEEIETEQKRQKATEAETVKLVVNGNRTNEKETKCLRKKNPGQPQKVEKKKASDGMSLLRKLS